MHLRPVKYSGSGGSSIQQPATLFDGNNSNRNFQFTVRHRSPQQSSIKANIKQPAVLLSGVNKNINTAQAAGIDIEGAGKRILALKSPTAIGYFNNDNDSTKKSSLSNAFLAANGFQFSAHDKMKLMELTIINLIDLSCLACEKNNLEMALMKAKEALDVFASLRSIVLQKQQSNSTSQSTQANLKGSFERQCQPMTTGVRLIELALMVNCNLAVQLQNNALYEQSLELYTQITKLAGSSASTSGSNLLIAAQQLTGETKFLLYRFGINIGNVLCSIKDYQRALKYYRLTLDRLSSSQVNEAISSMKLLLADNLSHQQQQQQLLTNGQSYGARKELFERNTHEPCNSNHHRFALSLIVCYHQQRDPASLRANLKALVSVDICHQYERVLYCARGSSGNKRTSSIHDGHRQKIDGGGLQESEQIYSLRANEIGSVPSSAQADRLKTLSQANLKRTIQPGNDDGNGFRSSRTMISASKRRDVTFGQELNQIVRSNESSPMVIDSSGVSAVLLPSSSGTAGVGYEHIQQEGTTVRLTKPSVADKLRQVMSSIEADRLEMLIGEKDKQILRSIMLTCNLLLDLQTSSVSLSGAYHSEHDNEISAFDFCLNLLSASQLYKNLVYDLKTNKMIGLLNKRYKLNEAMHLFKEIGARVHPHGDDDDDNDDGDHDGHFEGEQWAASGQMAAKALTSRLSIKSNLLTEVKYNQIPSQKPLKSSIMATNGSFICRLQKRKARALEESSESCLGLNADLAASFVNHANCLYDLNRFTEADLFYQNAIKTKPTCWEAHYNLAIVCRKLGRDYDHLSASTKFCLAKDRQIFVSSLLNHDMILSTSQLALIFAQSGNEKQAITILNDLVTHSRQAPEAHLLISKLVSDDNTENSHSQARSVLQQAHRENLYHLPVLERLIALTIKSFDYESARQLLIHCVNNRPDQVKWFQMLAECHRRSAEYNKAIIVYKTAITTFPRDTSCLKALIKLTDELGMTEEKRAYENKLDKALKRRLRT